VGAPLIAFDFLADPRVALAERFHAVLHARGFLAPAVSLVLALGVAVGVYGTEHVRYAGALADLASRQTAYAEMRSRLVRERIEAGETADLGRLDGRLEDIGDSGRRLRSRLSALAERVPLGAWLTTYAENAGSTSIVGRTNALASVTAFLRRDGRLRLVRVTRIENAGRPLLEFDMEGSLDAGGG